MNWDQIESRWHQLKGRVRGALTDDDVETIAGKRDVLCSKIQARYGITRELAEKELAAFESECRNNSA
jgi:uncharacterized protein YjbJ (UPF0337 family)